MAVGLDAKQVEPALHGGLGDAGVLGHGSHTPVRGVGRGALQRGVDHFGDALVLMRSGPTGAQFVVQPCKAEFEVAPAPFADGHVAQAQALGDGGVGLALGAVEHDLGPLHEPVRQ